MSTKSGDALHLPPPLRFSTKKKISALQGERSWPQDAMAMQHAPPHLTVTKAFLTDNPYENQLGLLRWIRKFLSEVVDAAASQSESDQHRRQEEQKEEEEKELAGDACKEDDQEQGCALGAPTQEEKREEHSTSGAISKSVSTEEALEESLPCVEGVEADTVAPSNSIVTEGCKESGTAASAGGRKRPRNLLHGQDLFGVGSVVECFHPVSREVHIDKTIPRYQHGRQLLYCQVSLILYTGRYNSSHLFLEGCSRRTAHELSHLSPFSSHLANMCRRAVQ